MDNERSYPDSYYNYGEYNEYQNYRHASLRNENLLQKESLLKASDENKTYYRDQENFQDSYSDDQLWNMQGRRVPNSSYSMFPLSQKQNLCHSVAGSQMRNNLPQKHDLPLKGILVGGHSGNNLEGMHRNNIPDPGMTQERKDTNQHRPKSPQYRLPSYRSNENFMATLCGGEPVLDMDDSQYYLINDRKPGQENEKNLYDEYNEQTDDEISCKDENAYGYNSVDNDLYDSSLRDISTFNPRERANMQFPKQIHGNNHCEKPEGSAYGNNDNDYYMHQQRNVPGSSQGYNQSRLQNLNRSRNLMHPPINRQEMYKQLVSEKLNETFTELKNAGLNDKNEEYKPQRKESFAVMDRYKYQDLINENSKRSAMMSHLNKYKMNNDNEQINRRFHYPLSKTQDASCNTNRKIQMCPDEQKFKNSTQGELGSFVHMHKEYQNCLSVPDCCVDVYKNYRKEKIPDSMLRIE